MNLELLKKYGFPTAFAAALLAIVIMFAKWQHEDVIATRESIEAKIDKIGNDVDFLSRTVDLACRPRG